MDTLTTIKQLIIRRRYLFTQKALNEMDADNLCEYEVLESILNAQFFRSKRSTSKRRNTPKENVYIIESFSYNNILIYTKGVIRGKGAGKKFYVLISSKRSTQG